MKQEPSTPKPPRLDQSAVLKLLLHQSGTHHLIQDCSFFTKTNVTFPLLLAMSPAPVIPITLPLHFSILQYKGWQTSYMPKSWTRSKTGFVIHVLRRSSVQLVSIERRTSNVERQTIERRSTVLPGSDPFVFGVLWGSREQKCSSDHLQAAKIKKWMELVTVNKKITQRKWMCTFTHDKNWPDKILGQILFYKNSTGK